MKANVRFPDPTLLPFDQIMPQALDQREDERDRALLRVGCLLLDQRREVCLIRNISSGGALVRTFSRIPLGKSVAVELKQGESVAGVVRWAKDSSVGIMFTQPVDIVQLLAESSERPRPRQPRVEIGGPTQIERGDETAIVEALDISQGGIKVRSGSPLRPGRLTVSVQGLPPLTAIHCWSRGTTHGLKFTEPLALKTLVQWLREWQRPLRVERESSSAL